MCRLRRLLNVGTKKQNTLHVAISTATATQTTTQRTPWGVGESNSSSLCAAETSARAHTHTHAHIHTRTHARTHAHTHTHTHTHTDTDTHTHCLIIHEAVKRQASLGREHQLCQQPMFNAPSSSNLKIYFQSCDKRSPSAETTYLLSSNLSSCFHAD